MQLQAAILCDFAQVREGMLFVSSGGVTRLFCPRLPWPLPIHLALVLEAGPDEIDMVHEVRVTVTSEGGANQMGQVTLGFQPLRPLHLNPGEGLPIPLVLPLGAIAVTALGPCDVRVTVDGAAPQILTLYATEPPGTPPPPAVA